MLNRLNNYLTPSILFSGSLFTYMASESIMVINIDDTRLHADIRTQLIVAIFGVALSLQGMKSIYEHYKILNTHTFLAQKPTNSIPAGKLMILDRYAFDTDELIAYIQNDLTKLRRNPHGGEFSAAAKKIMQKHEIFAVFATRLERKLNKQKNQIAPTTIHKLIEMLFKINDGLEERAERDQELLENVTSAQDEEEHDDELESDFEEEEDEISEAEDNDLVDDIISYARQFIAPAMATVHELENVPPACEEARVNFAKYADTLGKNKRRFLNNYLIEVPLQQGGYQILKFKDAFMGGNAFAPCVTTLQIFLWQMVANFEPGAVAFVPDLVTTAANKSNLEIKPPNYTPTFLDDLLNYNASHRNRFFNLYVQTLTEQAQPEPVRFTIG